VAYAIRAYSLKVYGSVPLLIEGDQNREGRKAEHMDDHAAGCGLLLGRLLDGPELDRARFTGARWSGRSEGLVAVHAGDPRHLPGRLCRW
jgi:hypothetical protein